MNEIAKYNDMISEIKEILQSARLNVARQVNTELLTAYWNIGRIIVEHEQNSQEPAEYGQQILKELSKRSRRNLAKVFLSQTFNLCADSIRLIRFNRRCLLN